MDIVRSVEVGRDDVELPKASLQLVALFTEISVGDAP